MKLLTVFVLLAAIVAALGDVPVNPDDSNVSTGDSTTIAGTAVPDDSILTASTNPTTIASTDTGTITSEPTTVPTGETTSVATSEGTTSTSSPATTTVEPTTTVTTDETTSVATSEETTTVTTDETASTSSPTTATTSSATSETSSTTPSTTTTVAPSETTPNTDETTDATTNSTAASTVTPDTTPVQNGSTEAPSANKLQCYACEGDDCDEKTVINCPDDSRAYDVEDISKSLSENAAEILLQNYRSVARLELADVKGYACYRVQITDNDDKALKLGCIAIPYGQSACEAVRNELNITTTADSDECLACQTDLCNGSAIAKLSVAVLLSVLLAKFLF
ncbi:integumentary mucin A.1 isoform X2 [Bactrocera dorsalis]|uniref:Integumentary mucin A.1 isoform X2 n=1 Tax=Bactrocera dorsalis TaxID=27457 RepID=A0ABM3J1H6_BACDO|nr:integumentary mucin A.1 isoform X2 [Bactrocera dorsalis]